MPDLRLQPGVSTRDALKTKTRLAPNLLAGLKVLSLPVAELATYCLDAAEQNPVLEVVYDNDLFKLDSLPTEASFTETLNAAILDDAAEGSPRSAARRRFFEGSLASAFEWDFSQIEDDCVETETLHEYLHLQTSCMKLDPTDSAIMDTLIECISGDGYFTSTPPEIAFEFGVDATRVEELLLALQSCKPAGVAARSLAECLSLQIAPSDPYADALHALVTSHLDELAHNKITQLSRALGVSADVVAQLKVAVQSMNPRPGAAFYQRPEYRYAVPDIIVRQDGNRFEAEVVGAGQQCLALNTDYLALRKDGTLESDAQSYLDEKCREAESLLANLDQRRTMLQSFAVYLVKKQYQFFLTQGQQLQPMTMQEVADDLGVHVSTISRTVQGKYLQAPWGSVALKSLFTRAIERTVEGAPVGNISSFEIKKMILTLVETEPAESPFSDTKICELLNGLGVSIKRRTVAKYRAALGIDTQSARRWQAVGKRSEEEVHALR